MEKFSENLDAGERHCYVNCGLPGDQCACYRQSLSRHMTEKFITALAESREDQHKELRKAVAKSHTLKL